MPGCLESCLGNAFLFLGGMMGAASQARPPLGVKRALNSDTVKRYACRNDREVDNHLGLTSANDSALRRANGRLEAAHEIPHIFEKYSSPKN
eukprot:312773-Pelagomonas_calceolata.AAC.1